jgi:hypothetical protein
VLLTTSAVGARFFAVKVRIPLRECASDVFTVFPPPRLRPRPPSSLPRVRRIRRSFFHDSLFCQLIGGYVFFVFISSPLSLPFALNQRFARPFPLHAPHPPLPPPRPSRTRLTLPHSLTRSLSCSLALSLSRSLARTSKHERRGEWIARSISISIVPSHPPAAPLHGALHLSDSFFRSFALSLSVTRAFSLSLSILFASVSLLRQCRVLRQCGRVWVCRPVHARAARACR